MVKETPEGFFIVFVSHRTTTNCIREKYGWGNPVTRDSFWTALFSSMFTKQFVIVRWNNFPLTMCYETEKNKRESIKPVVMYNLQGQHLAANKNIFFFFFSCRLRFRILDNFVGGRRLFSRSPGCRSAEMIGYLEAPWVHTALSPCKQEAWMCSSHSFACYVTHAQLRHADKLHGKSHSQTALAIK